MLKYLLETSETIEEGVGFSQFDRCHMWWLLGFVLFTVLCCALYRRLNPQGRGQMCRVMALAVAANELMKVTVLLIGGNYQPSYLPLHLCSINLFVVLWQATHPGNVVNNYLYLINIPGAMMALLFPSWTGLPPTSLMHIHSFTFHILLVTYTVMQLAGGDIRPQVKYVPRCIVLLAMFATVAACANKIWDTNFMFLSSAGAGNPLQWFEDNWGNHLLGFPVLIPAVVVIMYAPVVIRERQHSCSLVMK